MDTGIALFNSLIPEATGVKRYTLFSGGAPVTQMDGTVEDAFGLDASPDRVRNEV